MPIGKPVLKVQNRPSYMPSNLVIQGSSGGGKTVSAAIIGKVLSQGHPYVMLSSEPTAPFMYDQTFGYDTVLPETFDPEYLTDLLHMCEERYACIIVDSISAEWNAVLAGVDNLKAKNGGEAFTQRAWGIYTPKHDTFMNALVTSPCHIIVTCQVKDKVKQIINQETGKKETKVLNGEPIQRAKALDLFTTNIFVTRNGNASVLKHRAIRSIDPNQPNLCPVQGEIAWKPEVNSTIEYAEKYSTWLKSLATPLA